MRTKVLFTCHQCKRKDVVVTVPMRGDEDVVTWINEKVMPEVGAIHSIFNCPARAFDLKFPFNDENAPLGSLQQEIKKKENLN